MTEEQYKVLEKYEQTLRNAVFNNFLRMPAAEFNEVAAVYDQLFTPLRPSQRNCNTCRLNALKTLGRNFLEEKARREAAKEENKQAEAAEVKAPKNKGGRPKKIKLED